MTVQVKGRGKPPKGFEGDFVQCKLSIRSHAAAVRCARSRAGGFPSYGKRKHVEIVAWVAP